MGVQKSKKIIQGTLRLFTGAVIFIFVVLFFRIAWLQIIKSEAYHMQAASNTMRWVPETAPRGEITDRTGEVLVTNRPVFNLTLDYLGLKDQDTEEMAKNLVEILQDPEITVETIKEAIKSQKRLFELIIIKRDIPIDLVTIIEEQRRILPGVNIEVQPQRSYPYSILAGHLLGYVHSIKKELEQPGFEDYGLGDLVGKIGLEKTYEHYLRGQNGSRQVEVTAKNKPVRKVQTVPSVPGDKLVLTVDLKLQQAMEKAFDETLARVQKTHPKAQAGAAVLLDVKTGQVLAMASRPTLNPDDFNGKPLSQERADYYFSQSPTALTNRAIQGNYVPGSTFKPITGMAVLEAMKVDPKDTVNCTGRYWNPPYIKCTGVHGRVNYYSAMAVSCNVYFQEMARRAGIEMIGKVGREFGLGQPTGIDLPFESTGLLPDLIWQQKEYSARAQSINQRFDKKILEIEEEYNAKIQLAQSENEKKRLNQEMNSQKRIWEQERKLQLDYYTQWHEFDTYNTGIGQGYNQYTVIQLANYVATIANGGYRYKPYTVQKIVAHDGSIVEEFNPTLLMDTTVSPLTIEETKKAMLKVTQPGGTANFLFRHFPEHIKVAAKTGTAQPGRTGYEKNKDFDGIFIAFAPYDDPQIAFAGVIEYGYSGGGSIGHVCKAVFEEYFGIVQEEVKPYQAVNTPPQETSEILPSEQDEEVNE